MIQKPHTSLILINIIDESGSKSSYTSSANTKYRAITEDKPNVRSMVFLLLSR